MISDVRKDIKSMQKRVSTSLKKNSEQKDLFQKLKILQHLKLAFKIQQNIQMIKFKEIWKV